MVTQHDGELWHNAFTARLFDSDTTRDGMLSGTLTTRVNNIDYCQACLGPWQPREVKVRFFSCPTADCAAPTVELCHLQVSPAHPPLAIQLPV